MKSQLKILKDKQHNVFEIMAKILGAMAAPVRLRLIYFLSQSPLTVEVLASKTEESVANTSMHLRKLYNEGLVSVEKIGQKRLYTLESSVLDFWESCQDFIQNMNPNFKMNFSDLYGEINWTEDWVATRKLIKNKEVLFLDVRPSDEILKEIINNPLVIHIAQSELKNNISKLPKRKKILVFCRGRMCGLSAYAVNYLRENGFKAYRLEDSWSRLKEEITN